MKIPHNCILHKLIFKKQITFFLLKFCVGFFTKNQSVYSGKLTERWQIRVNQSFGKVLRSFYPHFTVLLPYYRLFCRYFDWLDTRYGSFRSLWPSFTPHWARNLYLSAEKGIGWAFIHPLYFPAVWFMLLPDKMYN